jgi:hypothetical protein
MFLENLRGWLNRDAATAQRQHRTGNAKPAQQRPRWFRPVLEELEDRTLLSTIVWLNDGDASAASDPDPDHFQAAFGANASKARAIVRQAIYAWEELIVNFNYTHVGQDNYAPRANEFDLKLEAASLGDNAGHNYLGLLHNFQGLVDRSYNDSAGLNTVDHGVIGKPYLAVVDVDDNGGGNGWYFDPNPRDSAEFTKIITPFRAQGNLGGRADFYSTVLRMIGKAVGIATPFEAFNYESATYHNEPIIGNDPLQYDPGVGNDQQPRRSLYQTGYADRTSPTGFFITYLTDRAERGIYEGPPPLDDPDPFLRFISNDLMTATPPVNTRDLITDVDIGLLARGFIDNPFKSTPSYTLIYPSQLGRTFLDAPNAGTLTVRGSSKGDTITLIGQNNSVVVTINGNVSVYQGDRVRSVRVLAGDGNDTVRIDMQGLYDRPFFVDGGAGTDSITVVDNHDVANNPFKSTFTYTVTSSSVNRDVGFGGVTYGNLEKLTLLTGPGTVNVESTTAQMPVTITGSGNTTVKVSSVAHNLSDIAGALTLNVQAGLNSLFINDQAFDSYSARYDITANSIQRSRPVRMNAVYTGLITYNGFTNGVYVFGGKRGNQYQVSGSPSSFMGLNTGEGADSVNIFATTGPVIVDGQGGADTVNVGNNGSVQSIAGSLRVMNTGDLSTLNIDDTADARSHSVTLSASSTYGFVSGLAPALIAYLKDDIRALNVSAGNGGNTFTINDTLPYLFPDGNRIGTTLTTVNTGNGADQVYVFGTTGPLAVNVQGVSLLGHNAITVGSPTGGLNAVNGKIDLAGATGAVNDLTVNDAAFAIGHDYVMDGYSIQRLGKARIGYQHMSSLTLRTGAQTDHIVVQNTMPGVGFGTNTMIAYGGGDDRIDISRTSGPLLVYTGGHSAVSVGNATSSLDNIRGAIAVVPSGNFVTLNLNDQAATTPEQLDIAPAILATSFQRSGAANIHVLLSPLGSFQWKSGSGGTKINMQVRPAQAASFILGNDVLNVGTPAGTISDFGTIAVTGGIGPDAVRLNDSGETRPQSYSVSQVFGREIFATRGTIFDLGPDLEVFEVMGGAGGNTVTITGTIAGMSTILHTGAGLNSITTNGTGNSLQAIQGPVTLDGAGGTNTLTFDDQSTTTLEYYNLTADELTRADAHSVPDMAPISLAGLKAITLNVSSGGSVVAVLGSSAGSTVSVNGTAGGLDVFEVNPDFSSYLGPVFLSGQPTDYAYYDDYFNANQQTYTVRTDPAFPQSLVLESTDAAPIRFDDLSQVVFYLPLVGGSTINVNGLPAQTFLNMAVSSDTVTLGSIAPNLGGTLANIMGPVAVASYSPSDAVRLVLDDSGNADVTPKNVMLTPRNGRFDYGDHIEGFAPNTVYWNLGANAAIALRGGAADESFALVGTTSAAAISIDGGGGVNTLDYSGYAGPTSGLMSWYTAEGNANDAVGGNNGIAVAGVTYAQGEVGQAFNFNGVDSYIQVPNTLALESPHISVEAWVNATNPHLGGYILDKGDNGSLLPSYSLSMGSGSGLVFEVSDGTTYADSPDAGPGIWDGNWHHVVGTYDGATIRLYVDGAEVGNGTPTNIAIAYDLPNTNDLFIGSYAGQDRFDFNGLVDELSVYNRALSAADVQAIYAAGSAGKSGVHHGVVVNLPLGTATGLTGGIANIQNVIGSPGDDTLSAGADRSILIGGDGADQLFGGSGENILIGGTTDYTQPSLNAAALDAVLQEWNRTDLGFDDRVSDLLTGSNSQGVAARNVIGATAILLNSTTVHDDPAADVLTGGAGRDWLVRA